MADSNKSGSGWGWVGLITVVALLGAGYLYQREGGRLFGPSRDGKSEPPPPVGGPVEPPSRPEPVDSKPLAAQEGTGTLRLNVLGSREAQGWLFVDGQLRGDFTRNLPQGSLYREFQLTPGEHEVRWVVLLPPPQDYLVSVSAKVVIERGKDWWCTMGVDPTRFEQSRHLAPGVARQTRAPIMKARVPFWVAYRDSDMDALVRKTTAEVTQEWQRLRDSNRYRPILTVAGQLRTSPPAKRRVWIDLPDDLGGAREVHAAQLSWLRDWLLIEFDSFTQQVPTDITFNAGDVEGERRAKACQPKLDALKRQVHEWRQEFKRTLDDMIAALERAPADK